MKRILIVDDNEENLYLLRVLLEGHGYEVEEAANGSEALEKALASNQDLIISDILMPVMDGFSLCRDLKADDRLKHIPLIFYTATYTDHRDEKLALDMGANAFIIKPAEPDEFMRRIEEILAANKDETLSAPQKQTATEEVILKEYNEALIRKLEDKMLSLEQANIALEAEIETRKHVEEDLRRNNALFTRIYSQVPGMLYQFVRKPDGTYSVPFSSDGIREIFGCSPEDARETFAPIFQAIFPEDRDRLLQTIEESAKNLSPWICEYRVQLPGKPVKWVLGNSIPEKMADGTIFWCGYNTDITDRKRIVENLRESEERYRSITDNMSDFVSEIDPQGIFRYNSPSIRRILGYDPEELIGSCAFDLVHPEDREYVIARYMEGINTLSDRDVDQRYRCKNGTYIWLRSSGHPLYESTGEHIGMIVNSNDITERKLAEEKIHQLNIELEQKVAERTSALHDSQLALLNLVDDLNQSAKNTALATRRLEETNNELKAFSYSVSHDLRAPLRSIDGFSLALMEDYQEKLDDTGKNYLNKIRSATQHMGLLIEDMLKLSRISHAEFQHESIDLSNLVQSIAQTIQHNNPDKDMKMIIQKDIIIKGDRNSMEIALTNLLENAWKFTGKQKQPLIEFGMTLTEDKKVFFIRDNGVGFDMAYANKLFGAFQRLHSTDEFPGTGIGLATVKRIITRHGGQIWAEGEVGKGAAFFFTIPE